jgi:uncharacterized RDD family membrane protein YckC
VSDNAPFSPPEPRQLSGWWRRVWAGLCDAVVIAVLLGIFALLTHGYHLTHSRANGRLAAHTTTGYIIGSFLIAVGYQLITLCRPGTHNGQTLGKQLLGIKVERDDGQPFGLATWIIRQLVCQSGPSLVIRLLSGPSILIFLISLIDDLWPLWDRESRALHDMIAQTHVWRVDPPAQKTSPAAC